MQDTDFFCPASRNDWRLWLTENHALQQSVWLVCYKRASNIPSLSWSEAVDEALCFGWVDSRRKPIDEEKFMQFFCRRKAKSNWSKINKEKIKQLTNLGLMTPAGYESVETAKQNGSWQTLDEVEELKIPKDLAAAFKTHPGSRRFFLGLSRSVQKMILQWVHLAKRPETRQKRIAEVAELAGRKLKPVQFR